MSFQTYEYRDGQYHSRTVGLEDVLKAQPTVSRPDPEVEDSLPPACGVLTRTIIESPVVHWILPARLRPGNHNDVAFVGVSPHFQPSASPGQYPFDWPRGRAILSPRSSLMGLFSPGSCALPLPLHAILRPSSCPLLFSQALGISVDTEK